MDFQDRTTGTKAVVIAVTSALVLTLVGCAERSRSSTDRLPGDRQLVGGGIMIEWRAPEPGTVYLVEKTTGKMVETHSLEEGEVYTWTVASTVQAEDLEELLGIKFSKAHFLLYFEPAGQGSSAP
jgi:hypothetical protein